MNLALYPCVGGVMDHGHEGAMLAAVPLKIGGVPLDHNGEHFGAVGHPLGYRDRDIWKSGNLRLPLTPHLARPRGRRPLSPRNLGPGS